jgi:hypothetical protein
MDYFYLVLLTKFCNLSWFEETEVFVDLMSIEEDQENDKYGYNRLMELMVLYKHNCC